MRAAAAELGLAVADKPDSQDICFVPEGRYTTVIDRLRPHGAEPGDIVHLDGRVLGRHEGVTRYTIGQRRGLNVAVGDPLFVVRIDADARQVIVGPREALLTARADAEGNQLARRRPSIEAACDAGRPVLARVRSTREPGAGRLALVDGAARRGLRRAGRRRRARPGLRALRCGQALARARRRLHRANARGRLSAAPAPKKRSRPGPRRSEGRQSL